MMSVATQVSSPELFLSGRHLAAGLTVSKVKAGLSLILGCGQLSHKGQRLKGESKVSRFWNDKPCPPGLRISGFSMSIV